MTHRPRRAYLAVLVAAILCATTGVAAATGPASNAQIQTEDVAPPAFVVTLHEDSPADVTVTYTFDLTDDARQDAFDELRTNESAESAFEDRFKQQLQGVAKDAANATGREMSITAVDVAFETSGDTGVVRVTATWDGLAATDGEGLTVTEPFASGFEPDRQFAVVVPDGYAVDTVAPSPDERSADQLEWTAGTDLEGFELAASPTAGDGEKGAAADDGSETGAEDDSPGGETPGDSGPGFGILIAVLGILGVGLFWLRR
ncbi:MAG: PGF-CTERM sorting domain-containing protein [Haloarculaceae archaeon]